MNTVDLYFDINEGKITKVNKIFYGNNKIASEDLKEIIKTKQKQYEIFLPITILNQQLLRETSIR